MEQLIFDEVQRQLQLRGFALAKARSSTPSSWAPNEHNSAGRQAQVKAGTVPGEWSPSKRPQENVQIYLPKKHGNSYFGYKLSVSVDRRHKLIR
ncbi:hypothetical protein [Pseudomonas sp. PDM19]|uniref:hypothetical protein n=1 Tax=Pseudomonas sp. PDM19 TaxID=2769272 RepID=UPI001CE06490|nr:hypothetical protein [Pseudomonas sp. PDM19]